MITLIIYSLISGVFSLIGGIALLVWPKITKAILTPLVAFAAGAFIAAALLDIIPEAIELVEEPHPIFIAVIFGYLLFFMIERFIMRFHHVDHSHHHSEHTESLSTLMIISDSFHNFLDGVIIGLTYIANPLLALPTTMAIAGHEIPQEIGDFAVLIRLGWSKQAIIIVNIFQSLLTIPGVLLGYYLGQSISAYLPYLLGAAGGIFLYIAASDLVPEIHHKSGHLHFFRAALPLMAGVLVMYFLSSFAHS